jgi:hypothetical protein
VPLSSTTERAARLCDTEWDDGQYNIIQLDERKDDGKPLEPFVPSDPMYPYELRGERYLFGEKGRVYRAVGRFEDRNEAQSALRKVESERPSLRPFVTRMGPYLVPGSTTCKATPVARMKNPGIDSASWLLEQDGLLLAGTRTECKAGLRTKKVSVLSCDGMKTLMTDSVTAPCEAQRVDTCIRPIVPGVVLFEHSYSMPGGTTLSLRVQDLQRKKRLQTLEASQEGGPDTELLSVEDVDQDGVPELVYSLAGSGQRTRVLKWTKNRFVETKSP